METTEHVGSRIEHAILIGELLNRELTKQCDMLKFIRTDRLSLVKMSRRRKLRVWWYWHRPHIYFGPYSEED